MAAQEQEAAMEAGQAERTFASVVRAHQSMVFSLAYHFLHNAAAAEEVAQDVFLELHRRFEKLESDAHITFWLRRVTSHRSIDYARRNRRQPVALEDVAEPSIFDQPADVLLNRRLQNLVASLPENPRMVMVLRFQEGLTPEEIAHVLGMPARTVKSHLQRSLAMLREKIGRSVGEVR
jgi:RNA polymerase sigma-70 factor (ECF subfamily)